MKKNILGLICGCLATIASNAEEYMQLDDWSLPLQKAVYDTGFSLYGHGVLRVGLVFKGYAAALYVDAAKMNAPLKPTTAKRLEIYYYHNTPRSRMIETANETLKRNLNAEELRRLRPLIDKLHSVYRDGPKGGMAALTFVPGYGTVFEWQNEVLVHIPGDEFGPAYLDVWLGKYPSSQNIKEQLLKNLIPDLQ